MAKHQFVHGLSFTLCFLLVPDTYRIAGAFYIFDHRLLKIVEIDVQSVHPFGCSIVELWTIVILEKQDFELSLWNNLNHFIKYWPTERTQDCPIGYTIFLD